MGGLQDFGQSLLDKNYNFVPILPNQKRPSLTKWQSNIVSQEQLNAWLSDPSRKDDGVGILTHDTPAIDLDIQNAAVAQHMYDFINIRLGMGPNVVTRTGKPPKLLIPCRTDTPFQKLTSIKFKDSDDKKHMIEILGSGQQYVAHNVHPDTGKDYQWSDELPARDELPILTLELIQDIFQEFENVGFKNAWSPISTSNTSTSITSKPNSKSQMLKKVKGTEERAKYTESEIKHILDKCPLLEDYDGWLRIGMSLAHQYKGEPEGLELWDYYSQKLPNYNRKELEKKWPTFSTHDDQGNTLGTLIHLASPPDQTMASVIVPNPKRKELYDFWYSAYVYAAVINKFVNVLSGSKLTPDAFSNKYTSEVPGKKPSASTFVLNKNLVPKVQHIGFYPGLDLIVIYKGEKHLNTYVEPKLDQDLKKYPIRYPTEIDDLLTRMIPIAKERALYVSWLKHVVMKPGIKVQWAPVLIGPQGNGKTTSWTMTASVIGTDYVTPISPSQLSSRFNGYAEGSIVGGFDEVRVHGENSKAIMDKLKTPISDNFISLELKGQEPRKIQNVTSYVFTSNRPDAFPITDDDRRYMVIQTIQTKNDINFDRIYEIIEKEPLSMKLWFERQVYDPDFKATGGAYRTQSTLELIGNTTDPLEDEIKELIKAGNDFINEKFVCISLLLDRLNLNTTAQTAVTNKLLTYKLLHMGWTKYNKRVMLRGNRYTVYVPNAAELHKMGLLMKDVEDAMDNLNKKVI